MTHARITVDPAVMAGKPVIRGTRVPVEAILRKLGAGWPIADILDAYPHLTPEDVYAAAAYAADVVGNEEVILSESGHAVSGG
jgi:uncharacterized protein (DUF433 family)